jgi:hypothetical protein
LHENVDECIYFLRTINQVGSSQNFWIVVFQHTDDINVHIQSWKKEQPIDANCFRKDKPNTRTRLPEYMTRSKASQVDQKDALVDMAAVLDAQFLEVFV